MSEYFRQWWMSGGSEQWAKALDAEGGTLSALEMVFTSGSVAGREVVCTQCGYTESRRCHDKNSTEISHEEFIEGSQGYIGDGSCDMCPDGSG